MDALRKFLFSYEPHEVAYKHAGDKLNTFLHVYEDATLLDKFIMELPSLVEFRLRYVDSDADQVYLHMRKEDGKWNCFKVTHEIMEFEQTYEGYEYLGGECDSDVNEKVRLENHYGSCWILLADVCKKFNMVCSNAV